MTPQKREQVIKAIVSGNLQDIEQINEGTSFESLILCAYYLLEHGRPSGYTTPLSYVECYIKSIDDLKDIEAASQIYAETLDYKEVSLEALLKLSECMECYQLLKESRQLAVLNGYRHYLNLIQ